MVRNTAPVSLSILQTVFKRSAFRQTTSQSRFLGAKPVLSLRQLSHLIPLAFLMPYLASFHQRTSLAEVCSSPILQTTEPYRSTSTRQRSTLT